MSLQKQNLPIPIGKLDTLTDLRQLPIGATTLVENMMRSKGGALRKRNGSTAITSLSATSNRQLAVLGTELVDFNGAGIITVNSLSSARSLVTKRTTYQDCRPAVLDVYSSQYAQTIPDIAINGNYALLAWEDSFNGGLTFAFRVVDLVSNTVLLDIQQTTGNKPKCVSIGTFLMVFYFSAANTLTVKKIDTSGAAALTVASTTNVGVNAHANQSYDVQARADVTRVAVAYHSTVPDIKAIDWNPATDTATTTTSVAGQLSDRCCGWLTQDWNTVNVQLAICDSANGTKYVSIVRATFAVASTTAITAGETDIRNVTGYYDGTTVRVLHEKNNATTFNVRVLDNANPDGFWSCGLGSKVFKMPGNATAYGYLATYDSPTQKTYFVVSINSTATRTENDQVVAARILYGNGGGLSSKRSTISNSPLFGSLIAIAALKATRLDTVNGAFVTQSNPVLLTLDYSAGATLPTTRELGGALYMTGGQFRAYDVKLSAAQSTSPVPILGEVVAPLAPEAPTLTQGAGGACTLLATYKVRCCYVSVDAHGRIRRSAPSDVSSITLTGANATISIAVPCMRVSDMPYAIEAYGTAANGSTFYRLAAFGTAVNLPTGFDTQSNAGGINATDATIEAGEPLYTDSGELPNFGPPAFTTIETHRSRIWGINAEDTREVWFSKEIQPGLGVGFHPDLKLRLEGSDGGAFALASMDDKLICFKKSSIYVTIGDGPDNRGTGQFFSPFTLVTRNVGTVDPKSVMRVPDGIVFKSTRGLWMINRSLDVQYVGGAVDAYNSLTITSTVLVESINSHVRYTTSSGRTLVYDYSWDEWFTFTGQAAISAVVYQDRFTYVTSAGALLQEDSTVFGDAGAPVTMAVELAPIDAAGGAGWERAYELYLEGEFISAATLLVKAAYDYGTTNQETLSIALGGIQVDSAWRVRMRFARRLCEALRIRIEESSINQGFTLAMATLIVGVKGGKGGRIAAANAAT